MGRLCTTLRLLRLKTLQFRQKSRKKATSKLRILKLKRFSQKLLSKRNR